MYVYQILKDEKVSIIYLPSYRDCAFQGPCDKVYFHLLNLYQFLIKRLLFNLKKQSKSKLLEKENKFNCLTGNSESTNNIRIEISSEKVNDLLARRQICASDIRCLDTKSKQCLKKLCLKTCLYKTTHSNLIPQQLDDLNLSDSFYKKEKF